MSASTTLPVRYNALAGVRYARTQGPNPPGANRWEAPRRSSRNPVVLVHGFGVTMALNWYALSPLLANNGFDVFALDYGARNHGIAVRGKRVSPHVKGADGALECASELSSFVDRVRAETGAAKVDLVCHSYGALVAQYYLKRLGGNTSVERVVGLAPTWHGTTVNGLLNLPIAVRIATRLLGPAMIDHPANGDFVRDLYQDGDTADDVDYTAIIPGWDRIVTPIRRQRLDGPRVENVRLRTIHEHSSVAFSRKALDAIVVALTHDRP